MKKLLFILFFTLIPTLVYSYDDGKWLDSEKNLNAATKKEIREYLVKSKEISDESRLKRKQLKSSLSPEAQKALADRKTKMKKTKKVPA